MRPDGPGEFCLGWGADLLSASTAEKTVVCPGGQAACRGCGHFSRRDLGAYMTCFSPRQHSASLSPLTIHVSYVSLSNDPRDSAAASVCTHTHTTQTHTHKGTCTQAHTYTSIYTHTSPPAGASHPLPDPNLWVITEHRAELPVLQACTQLRPML